MMRVIGRVVSTAMLAALAGAVQAESEALQAVEVIATTPVHGVGLSKDRIPAHVEAASARDLERTASTDVTEFLARALGSVTINAVQNNPLQPDLQFRGYTASPLLGVPQGIAVYQNGVRINEPFGDAVNWDLIPDDAIASINLVGGTNPLFGLNSLGGALTIEMKNAFNYDGHALELSGGSFGRQTQTVQSAANDGRLGYYIGIQRFQEDGWRDLSESRAINAYAAFSLRTEATTLDLAYQRGDSVLTGNGPLPQGLVAIDRASIFTAPDETRNDLHAVTLNASHFFGESLQTAGTLFYRRNRTDSLNGDASRYVPCTVDGANVLTDGQEADALAAAGIDCTGGTTAAALAAAGAEVVTDADGNGVGALSPGGVLRDAIDNASSRDQRSYGGDVQATWLRDVFGRENQFIAGGGYYRGAVSFDSDTEVTTLDPFTRTTATSTDRGIRVGANRTRVDTDSESYSLYFTDTLRLTERLSGTVSGRWNHIEITLRDRTGERPELNGDHSFERFNPSVGLTYQVLDSMNLYGSYSESSRAPTPIELSCNDAVADAFAARTGTDDFECRLPNAFLSDPPLNQVVTRSYEGGARGRIASVDYHLGYFRSRNEDDIIFQSTGRATGLFKNVDATLRRGIEAALGGEWRALRWSASYGWLDATFASGFDALSPNHPNADAQGLIHVASGDRIPGLPRHSFKLNLDYLLARGLTLGGDLVVNSDQVLRGDESNQLATVSGYAIVNLRASYTINENVEVYARVDNVFDTDYETFGLLGEDPTGVVGLSGIDPSPRYLGVGAPIGGWVGLRLRL